MLKTKRFAYETQPYMSASSCLSQDQKIITDCNKAFKGHMSYNSVLFLQLQIITEITSRHFNNKALQNYAAHVYPVSLCEENYMMS